MVLPEEIDASKNAGFLCLKCGCAAAGLNRMNGNIQTPEDASSIGFAVLSFFFPLVGLILWLVWNDSSPKKAKSCGLGALVGFLSEIALSVIAYVVVAAILGLTMTGLLFAL